MGAERSTHQHCFELWITRDLLLLHRMPALRPIDLQRGGRAGGNQQPGREQPPQPRHGCCRRLLNAQMLPQSDRDMWVWQQFVRGNRINCRLLFCASSLPMASASVIRSCWRCNRCNRCDWGGTLYKFQGLLEPRTIRYPRIVDLQRTYMLHRLHLETYMPCMRRHSRTHCCHPFIAPPL
jgi:hypothetical protein